MLHGADNTAFNTALDRADAGLTPLLTPFPPPPPVFSRCAAWDLFFRCLTFCSKGHEPEGRLWSSDEALRAPKQDKEKPAVFKY